MFEGIRVTDVADIVLPSGLFSLSVACQCLNDNIGMSQAVSSGSHTSWSLPAQVHSRRARLVYLPAYIFGYSYGLKHTPGRGAIVPERFQALVGGSSGGGLVAAALHPSPLKAQLFTAALVAGLAALTGPVTAQVLGWDGLLLKNWGAVDTVFWGFMALSAAGAHRTVALNGSATSPRAHLNDEGPLPSLFACAKMCSRIESLCLPSKLAQDQ